MSWAPLLAAAEAARVAVIEREPDVAGRRLAAIGWATVERDRAERELDELLAAEEPEGPRGARGTSWAEHPRDPVLGARAWLRQREGADDLPALVILEPDTEGRLAASLARFGEGVAVIYLADGLLGAGVSLSGALVRGGPPWGPHAILLDARGPADEGDR